jgi:hypothetical protein
VSAEAVELSVDGSTVGHAQLSDNGDLTFTDLVNGQSRVIGATDLDQFEADAPQIAFADRH